MKTIPHAGLRNDGKNISGIACQFPAQIAYRDTQEVDRVLILCAAPDLVNELMVSPDPSGMTGHNVQKMVFGSCESDLFVADEHLSPVELDSQLAGFERFALHAFGGTTQNSPYPRHHLSRGNRLQKIVVGARVEAADHFRFLIPHGDHDNRHGYPLPQPSNKIRTVHVRQIQFEHDQLRPCLLIFQQRIFTGGSEIEAIACGFERAADDSAYIWLSRCRRCCNSIPKSIKPFAP